jgi:hypothetical protein
MPVVFDEFGNQAKLNFDQPIHEFLGELQPALRLKSSKSTSVLPSDNLSGRLSTPSGLAFANRYDFGASLTAAVQAAKDGLPKSTERDGGLYMKSNKKSLPAPERKQPSLRETASDPTGLSGPSSQTASAAPGPGPSASYEELVNKYCFVRTPNHGRSKASPRTRTPP